MAKPVHSMIRVFDEAKSLDFYARAFGLEVADHLKFAPFAKLGGHRSVTRADEPVQLLRKRPRQKRGLAGCQCSPPSPIAPD